MGGFGPHNHASSKITDKGGIPNPKQKKIIIDTDPGIDDAMAIYMALNSPELDVVGITTTFGNAQTETTTRNALYLLEVAGRGDIPVAEGTSTPVKGGPVCFADFAHGSDGLGETFQAHPKAKKIATNASDFLLQKSFEFPGEITVVALGPLTNIAVALEKDPAFLDRLQKLFILGGAFFSSGNVNPAAEANMYYDPEAADIVFETGSAKITVIGINITTRIIFRDEDLAGLKDKEEGGYGEYLYEMCRFYKDWHKKSDGIDGIFVHSPTWQQCYKAHTLLTEKEVYEWRQEAYAEDIAYLTWD